MTILNVHRFGAGDDIPVVCIHGVTGHGRRWRRMAEETLAARRVLAVDLRGHGRSSWAPPWRVEDHVADVLETLDAEGVTTFQLVGHSFGGLIAAHLLAAAPTRVERVALVDPAIALAPELALGSAEDEVTPTRWGSVEEAKVARRAARTPAGYAGSDEDVEDHLTEHADGLGFRFCTPAAITAWGEMARPPAELAGIDVEVLLLTATQAPYVTDATRHWLKGDLGNRFREVVIDSTHMLYWDAFEETSASLGAFLLRA